MSRRSTAAANKRSAPAPACSSVAYQGKTICFTGSLNIVRRTAERLASSKGLRVVSSVSGGTSIVVAGPGAGSKLDKAKQAGAEIWTEDQFNSFISSGEVPPAAAGATAAKPNESKKKKRRAKDEDDDDDEDEEKNEDGDEDDGKTKLKTTSRPDHGGPKFVTVEGAQVLWRVGFDLEADDIDYPIPESFLHLTLATETGEAASIARELQAATEGLRYDGSKYYPFAVLNIPSPTRDDTETIMRKAMGLTDPEEDLDVQIEITELSPEKEAFREMADNASVVKSTKLVRSKVQAPFVCSYSDSKAYIMELFGGYVCNKTAIAGIFAVELND